jgi:hypothetical protein
MFISRQAWIELINELAAERLKRESAEKELAIERNNADWLRANANVANSRADALFTQFTAARVPTPMFERAPSATKNNEDDLSDMTKGGALPSLEDPGDELAQRLGIDHAPDGSLVYR